MVDCTFLVRFKSILCNGDLICVSCNLRLVLGGSASLFYRYAIVVCVTHGFGLEICVAELLCGKM